MMIEERPETVLSLPMTTEQVREMDRELGPWQPFGRQLVIHMGWTLRRLRASEPLLEMPEGVRERALTDELHAARIASETAFTRWAVPTIRMAGLDQNANALEAATGWDERSAVYFQQKQREREDQDDFTPADEAALQALHISGRMKNLGDPNQPLSIQRRLQNLAEEIANAGYALAWEHQRQGLDLDLRAEFTRALQEAGIA